MSEVGLNISGNNMNYELVTGLLADRLSDEVLVSELLQYMGINTNGELESLASSLLNDACEWSVYRVDMDSLSVFKTTRGRGYLKRKDMLSLCSEFNIDMFELKHDYLESIFSVGQKSLEDRFNDIDNGIIFQIGDDENLLGILVMHFTDELDVDRVNLKRALNKYLDSEAVGRFAESYEGADDEEEFIEWLLERVGSEELIPWASIPENVFILNEEALKKIRHIEIEIDGVLDAMENIEFIRMQLKKII